MYYPAIVIANELVNLANSEKRELTPLKLQKILFLANGISWKRLGDKLIEEPFEAWDYGPVVSSVYYAFKEYIGNNIEEPIDSLIPTGYYSSRYSTSITVDEDHRRVIKEAWDNAKHLTAFTLSAWSHNTNSPWEKAKKATPSRSYITDEDIKFYFENFIKQ